MATSMSQLRVASFAEATTMKPAPLQRSFLSGGSIQKATAQKASPLPLRSVKVEANLFSRIVRVAQSYANAIVSSAEDPEKMLDQTVNEMSDDLIKMRQATAQVIASQKLLENKYVQAQSGADEWYKKAQLALEKGEEGLAREALSRRKTLQDNADSLKVQLDSQKGAVEKLISNTKLLEGKIAEARSKKDTLKARAQSAKTSQKVNEMVGSLNTSSALAAFEKMEEKVLAMEAESESIAALTTDDLAGKFALLEANSVDDDLEALKRGMLKSGSSTTGALPPGRTGGSAIDDELEALRKKTKEL